MTLIALKFICPVCRSEKKLQVPKSIVLEAKEHLTTMFIDRGLVCDHQFQALIDKNFIIQRYHIVDFEGE